MTHPLRTAVEKVKHHLSTTGVPEIQELEAMANRLEHDYFTITKPMRSAITSIRQALPGPDNPEARKSHVWRLVIGMDKSASY